MATIVDEDVLRSEALPQWPASRRPPRGSSPDRPRGDEPTPGDSRFVPEEGPRRLPLVLRGIRVLVVDDDEDTMELFASALAACGAVVATAGRARDALRLVTGRRVDIVVSDIAMPGGDGYWLIQEVRRLPDTQASRIPMVAVTAYDREHSRARVIAAGFADHLQKPIDPEALCHAIAKAMGR